MKNMNLLELKNKYYELSEEYETIHDKIREAEKLRTNYVNTKGGGGLKFKRTVEFENLDEALKKVENRKSYLYSTLNKLAEEIVMRVPTLDPNSELFQKTISHFNELQSLFAIKNKELSLMEKLGEKYSKKMVAEIGSVEYEELQYEEEQLNDQLDLYNKQNYDAIRKFDELNNLIFKIIKLSWEQNV